MKTLTRRWLILGCFSVACHQSPTEVSNVELVPNPSIAPSTTGAGIGVMINEVDADTPGSDAREFIELYDGGAGNTPLDGLVVVLYNGSTDLSYQAFDLDGLATDGHGFFLLGNAAVSRAPELIIPNNTLQNGADAVALYAGDAAAFPAGTAITTDHLIDAIVYDTDDADDPGLLALLNTGQPQVNEAGAGDKDHDSSQRVPLGTGGVRNTRAYAPRPATPGTNVEGLPSIVLETAINGEDADVPPGPEVLVGDSVFWTYTVTNTSGVSFTIVTLTDDGGVIPSCPQSGLGVGETMVCSGNAIARTGQYAGSATAEGRSAGGETATDDDPGHYFGASPLLLKERAKRDVSALLPTGNRATDRHLSRALERLDRSLDWRWWTSDTTLDRKGGKRVFDAGRQAIDRLVKVAKRSESVAEGAQGVIDRLLESDRGLAQVALASAIAGNGNLKRISCGGG